MSASSPPETRTRRPPVKAAFDPFIQPIISTTHAFEAVPESILQPAWLRQVLTSDIKGRVDIPDESVRRYPGREGTPVEAAVLVPFVMRPQGVTVLLTQRTAHLNDHAGQISFPGGRIEASDADAVAAAIRETEEETGLMHQYIEVLGTLPRYLTATGFAINPITALVKPDFELNPDSFEVAEVFEVPLSFLTNPVHYRLHRATLADGSTRQYYSAPWNQYFIWGATAAMLLGLSQVLSESAQL
ncbi:CoA pyrophosphatase [Orrella sp. NBD-18]|uniref:CoA pyrophosphatase n=1 Tax=Sheuella amnicola TaxID=2707330 RepID=A0A6B2R2P7_9BURK|nr:CoA pyrophosphatase [Sheuella amnicola]NDY83649.1 CoA pyrophosphatase [Sheuella amnicola]